MPEMYLFGGCNGAGKTTAAREVVPRVLELTEFVNADIIASGLSLQPEGVARQAGRLMLERIDALIERRKSFAFESTLASRSFAPLLRGCLGSGYQVHLLYVWLRSPELAVQRVAARVRAGGHSIAPDVVRRRYHRSLHNALTLYIPLATSWVVADNSASDDSPQLVARGGLNTQTQVLLADEWATLEAAGRSTGALGVEESA